MDHVLLVSGHGSYDTRRTEVETLERRPEHALDVGELEHDICLRIEGGHLVPRHGPKHSSSRTVAVWPRDGRDKRRLVRLAHDVRSCECIAHSLEPHSGVALDEDPERTGSRAEQPLRRSEDVLGDTVSDVENVGSRIALADQPCDPAG